MRNIILLLTIFYNLQSSAQLPLFEKSFMPMVNSGFNKVVHDSAGYFYSVGSSLEAVEYSAPGLLVKYDQTGNVQIEKYFYFDDLTYFNDVLIAPDGNLLVCGSRSGCDFGSTSGLILKLTPGGDTLWTKEINVHSLGIPADYRLSKIVSLSNGNLLFAADTTLFICSGSGDSLFSFTTVEKVNWVDEGLNRNIICGVQSGLVIFDSLGQILNQITLPSQASFVSLLPDSTCLVGSDSSLSRLDTAYNLINQFNLPAVNYTANHIYLTSDKIWITNSGGSDFASFNLNLQLIDSFRTQGAEVSLSSLSVFDSSIIVVGREAGHRSYCYMKSFSTAGNSDYHPVDLALIDIAFDTALLDQPSPLPGGVYRLKFVSRITVENTGSDTIRSFFANAQSLLGGPCGGFTYSVFKENLNILPGQTFSFHLDTLGEFGLVLSNFPFQYRFCAWISCPNFNVDKDHSNDYLCDTLLLEDPNSIFELDPFPQVATYPNPAGNSCTIELPAQAIQETAYILYDCFGKEISSGIFPQKINSLDLTVFSPGVYLLKTIIQSQNITTRIIKL
jgi:hypothetical protein